MRVLRNAQFSIYIGPCQQNERRALLRTAREPTQRAPARSFECYIPLRAVLPGSATPPHRHFVDGCATVLEASIMTSSHKPSCVHVLSRALNPNYSVNMLMSTCCHVHLLHSSQVRHIITPHAQHNIHSQRLWLVGRQRVMH